MLTNHATLFAVGITLAAALSWPAAAAAAGNIKPVDEAAAISQIAMVKAKTGDFKLCAELYHQAYRINPAFLGYLYSAARCAQKGGDLDAAERDYRALLARAPADNELVPRASRHIEEVLAVRRAAPAPKPVVKPGKPVPVAPKPAKKPPPTVVAPAQPASDWQRPAGWVGVAVGGAALALGGWWLVDGLGQRGDLMERLDNRKGGLVAGITYTEAQAAEDDYRGALQRGAIAAGSGLLLGGIGAWLLAAAPEAPAVSLLPAPGGFRLRLAWR